MAKNNNIWQMITASLFVVVGTSVLTHSTQAASGNGTGVAEMTITYQGPELGSCEPVTANEMRLIVDGLDSSFDPSQGGDVAGFQSQLDDVFDRSPKKPKGKAFYNNIMNWAANTDMTPQKHQYLRYTLKQLEILLKERSGFSFQDVYDQYLKDTGGAAEVDVNGVKFPQGWVYFYDDTLSNQEADDLGKLMTLLGEIKQNRSNRAQPLPTEDIDAIIVELERLKSALGSGCGGEKGVAREGDNELLDTIPCEELTAEQKARFSRNSASLTGDFKNMGIMITKVQEIINPDRAFDLKGTLGYINKGDLQAFRVSRQRHNAAQLFEEKLREGTTGSVEWRKGGEDEDKNTLISSMSAAIEKEKDATRKAALQAIHDKFVNQKVASCVAPAALPAPQPISCSALSEVEKERIFESERLGGDPAEKAAIIDGMTEPAKSIFSRLVAGTSTLADYQFLRVRYFHQSILSLFNDGGGRKPAQVEVVQPTAINFTDSPQESGETKEPAVIPIRSAEDEARDAAIQPLLQIDPSDLQFNAKLIAGLNAFINANKGSQKVPANKVPEIQAKLAALDAYLKSIQLANCGGGSKPIGSPSGPGLKTPLVPAPKPAVTPTPKPTVTPPAPKPAPKPAVSSTCPMLKREDIFKALGTTVQATNPPKVGSPESAYAAFDKNINTPYNRNNSKGGTSHYNLLKKAARGTPLTAVENKAVSQTLLNTLEGSASKGALPPVHEALRQSLKGCK